MADIASKTVRHPRLAVWVLLGLTLAMPPIALDTASAQQRRPRRDHEQRLVLRPANWAQLANVAAVQASVRTSHVLRQPVTDLMVRLEPTPGNALIAALAYPDDARNRQRTLLLASLVAVAGGRLLVEETARCGPWQADMALCAVGCDGGVFGLLRRRTPDGMRFSLAIGRLPAGDEGLSDGPRMGACADDGADVRLTTLAGPPVAVIDLAER